ncbi:MAG TPA: hypothetical protein VJU61_13770 [Polyangiaceae bacterium]|nr:hypothetical protein [Polyangiaceae bacterium]
MLAVLVLAGAGGAGLPDAFAQSLTEPGAAASTAGEASVDLSPPASASDSREQELSLGERLTRGNQFVALIERASQSITRQLQAARKDRDVVRVLCLTDKLSQVDVALSSAQDRAGALRTAVERADADRSRHEYTVLEVLNDRVRVLVNESNQCVGEETGFIGDAEVSVSVDPNLPDPDTAFDLNSNSPPPPPNISSPIE